MRVLIDLAICVFVFLCAGLCFHGYIRFRQQTVQYRCFIQDIQGQGVTTEGVVVRHLRRWCFFDCILLCQYQVEDAVYVKRQKVGMRDFKRLPDGAIIAVRYLPEKADQSLLVGVADLLAYDLNFFVMQYLFLAILFALGTIVMMLSLMTDVIRH